MKKLNLKHRIIDTTFGEVMLKESTSLTGEKSCDMYNGDNFDDYIGSISCSLDDDYDVIVEQIEEKLFY
jgi:hypothetical protein